MRDAERNMPEGEPMNGATMRETCEGIDCPDCGKGCACTDFQRHCPGCDTNTSKSSKSSAPERAADVHLSGVTGPDVHGEAWQPVLRELVQAMRDYEMDAGDSPQKHRAMMDRAEALLAVHGAASEDRLTPEERAQVEWARKGVGLCSADRAALLAIIRRLAPPPSAPRKDDQ